MNMQEINAFVSRIKLSATEGAEKMTAEDAAITLREWRAAGVEDIPSGLTPELLASVWNDGIVYVRNAEGTLIDYESAVQGMDDDIREALSAELAPCTEQEFFAAYEAAHLAKYGEPWVLSEENPCW